MFYARMKGREIVYFLKTFFTTNKKHKIDGCFVLIHT